MKIDSILRVYNPEINEHQYVLCLTAQDVVAVTKWIAQKQEHDPDWRLETVSSCDSVTTAETLMDISERALIVLPETRAAMDKLCRNMIDHQKPSSVKTCCICGKELVPQLLRRHWEFFPMEGPRRGELGLRVSGWSCLNGCS